MRHISSLVVITAAVPMLAVADAARAQTPGEDTAARSRDVRQAGVPAPTAASDSLFRRAEQLVREGRGEAGRALVDTVLARTRPGSVAHAQALYWRASLAADAAEAERGYRRVIVEHAATRWAGDALLNLAQLELARGDQEHALLHLHRLEREHPGHESRARAAFWLARLHFDRKGEGPGCAALATARAAASPDDVELRNQIDYYAQRCIGVDTAVAAAAPRAAARDSQRVATAGPETAPATSVTSATSAAGGYTVQVAAFDTRAGAEALVARLKARGYPARLATDARPFRVRIGRYESRAEALAAQRRLKAKGLDGFVTEAEKP